VFARKIYKRFVAFMNKIIKEDWFHRVVLNKSLFIIIGEILHALVRILRRYCFGRILRDRTKSSRHADTVESPLFPFERSEDGQCVGAAVRR